MAAMEEEARLPRTPLPADRIEDIPRTPISEEREQEIGLLQFIIDEVEEGPSGILEELEGDAGAAEEPAQMAEEPAMAEEPTMAETPTLAKRIAKRRTECQRLIEGNEKFSIRGVRQMRDERMTRQGKLTIMPFSVNQKDEPTCSYVTLSKVLIFNFIGIMMDIDVSYAEKLKLYKFMEGFPLDSDTKNEDRFFKKYGDISLKGYVLIILFFYFFDWIKENDMRPYYLEPSRIPIELSGPATSKPTRTGGEDYNRIEIIKLYDYLKLTKTRLGGTTFTGNDWIQAITTELKGNAAKLKWKRTSLCTLNTKFSNKCDTVTNDTEEDGEEGNYTIFCNEVLLPITNKGTKVILTLYDKTKGLHDVMLVGIENEALLISNSWGHSIDVVPYESLPRVILENSDTEWLIFQFTFLLPVMNTDASLNELKIQYNFDSYQEFKKIILQYKIPVFDKLDPTTIKLKPSGGKKRTRRNKSKRRNKKTVSRI